MIHFFLYYFVVQFSFFLAFIFLFQIGKTILHLAVLKGHPGIVRLLLERSDVDPNANNKVCSKLYKYVFSLAVNVINNTSRP